MSALPAVELSPTFEQDKLLHFSINQTSKIRMGIEGATFRPPPSPICLNSRFTPAHYAGREACLYLALIWS